MIDSKTPTSISDALIGCDDDIFLNVEKESLCLLTAEAVAIDFQKKRFFAQNQLTVVHSEPEFAAS